MKIGKILNNNVVVIYQGKTEKIVMGCGIAFKKKVGDSIDENNIDKVFALENKDTNTKLQQLLKDIPMEYVEVSEKIIEYARTKAERNLNDFIYITLLDHMHMAIIRQREGICVKNIMLWDIKKFYREEFQIGLKALDIIEEAFDVRLPEDEAGFIALHIVNAQMDDNYNGIQKIGEVTKLIHQIVNIVKYHFQMKFDEESVYYHRFVTHLKFFALRLFQKNNYEGQQDEDLLALVKTKYQSAYECTLKITSYIASSYSYTVSEEEQLYLTIHIEKAIQQNR
ncbi:MAG: PRD domain-containing protein [Firmicutes bacterium]|jgi:beta-glucoside operon transcriptional antiterminator|nr:PRD domain-containing protein [Bacillota bacterium]